MVQVRVSHPVSVRPRYIGDTVLSSAYCDLLCNIVLAEYVALDNARLLCFRKVAYPLREDGVAVISPAIFGEETN